MNKLQKELLQQIFDKGVNGVLEQGRKSYEDELNCYVCPSNDKVRCVIGHSLTPDRLDAIDYSVVEEGEMHISTIQMLTILAIAHPGSSYETVSAIQDELRELQDIHDNTHECVWNDYCHNFLVECLKFANRHGLSVDGIDFELVPNNDL